MYSLEPTSKSSPAIGGDSGVGSWYNRSMSETTTPEPEKTIIYEGPKFRVVQKEMPSGKRYDFVERIGSVLVLPVTSDEEGLPWVVAIENDREHYGAFDTLPGGFLEGGYDAPEDPTDAGLRELRDETGYGFKPDEERRVSLFRAPVGHMIIQNRYVAFMHGVSYIGGEKKSDHERVTVRLVPPEEYLEPFFDVSMPEMSELNLALGKAKKNPGREVVIDWLTNPTPESTAAVARGFEPWLQAV